MSIRVNWANSAPNGFPNYSMYSAVKYSVAYREYDNVAVVELVIHPDASEQSYDLRLSGGDCAYIMNDRGQTIDVVRTFSQVSVPPRAA